MTAPRFIDDPAFRALRVNDLEGFHLAIINRQEVDFSGADLRGIDFRETDLDRLVLKDAYLRDADLRGCDLRHMDLEGASFHGARIAGAYFPASIPAAEIQMSVIHGTRVRTHPFQGGRETSLAAAEGADS
jgi:uncharacterized protein YjbI with pentapeptide repeats